MSVSVLLKSFGFWFVILVLAMANGMLREKVVIPVFGSGPGLITSGLILSACVFLIAFFAVPWYGNLMPGQWLLVGLLWLVLTILFEFSFGRFVQHKTWGQLLEAYTFQGGNMWPLVLIVILISPWLAARLQEVI